MYNVEAVRLLLEHGANPNIRSTRGDNALDLIWDRYNDDCKFNEFIEIRSL
jgi:hypothetical protein